jgi:hypothetical protein
MKLTTLLDNRIDNHHRQHDEKRYIEINQSFDLNLLNVKETIRGGL